MRGCTDPRAECSASVTHQPIFWLAALQHPGLGEATASWKHRSQKGPLKSHPNAPRFQCGLIQFILRGSSSSRMLCNGKTALTQVLNSRRNQESASAMVNSRCSAQRQSNYKWAEENIAEPKLLSQKDLASQYLHS